MTPSTAFAPARIEPVVAPAPSRSVSHPIAAKIRSNGSVCFRVFGASMFPWIRSGDLVFARRFGYEQASPGDVILFERNDRLFVHRVLRRAADGSSLITKGDALDREDAPVSNSEFLGRVIRIHRNSRHIDMESAGKVLLGRLIAKFSRTSHLYYRPLRFVKHLLFG
jgi:signal peptidase I